MYHDAFNPDVADVANMKEHYQRGGLGDVEVKKKLIVAINNLLDPMRERRAYYEARPKLVQEFLEAGCAAGRVAADETIHDVRAALKLDYFDRGMPESRP
jgi:tryptophanyl-tRNA synthetase